MFTFHPKPTEGIIIIEKKKATQQGVLSPPGGKLNMEIGESPLECACREAEEETGLKLKFSDFRSFGYVSEKIRRNSHWLMFCSTVSAIDRKTKDFDEGSYEFFCRQEIDKIKIPPSDSKLVWPFYDRRKEGFWGIRQNCSQAEPKIRLKRIRIYKQCQSFIIFFMEGLHHDTDLEEVSKTLF